MAYQQLCTKLAGNIKKFDVLKSDYLDKLEDYTLWDEFSDAKNIHFTHYEINSIDIVSFDSEDDSFRSYVSVYKQTNDSVYDRAEKAIENYNTLLLETKMEYAIWEELLKRIHLIRAIIEDSSSTFISTAN